MIFVLALVVILILNRRNYWNRKLRRNYVKNMKIDGRIEQLIEEINDSIKNDEEFKKIRIKYVLFFIFTKIILWGGLITFPIWLILFMYFDETFSWNLSDSFVKYSDGFFAVYIVLIILTYFLEKNVYAKYKTKFKEIMSSDLFPRIDGNIYWTMGEISGISVENNTNDSDFLKKFKIDFDCVNTENFSSSAVIKFEDYWQGKFLSDFNIEVLDYSVSLPSRKYSDTILDEGLFCKVSLNKYISDCVKIKINGNKGEIDGEISNDVKQRIIEFGKNSKLKFDISISNDVMYFKFKTFDFFEPKKFGNPVDEVIVVEYLNILLFIIEISKKIREKI